VLPLRPITDIFLLPARVAATLGLNLVLHAELPGRTILFPHLAGKVKNASTPHWSPLPSMGGNVPVNQTVTGAQSSAGSFEAGVVLSLI
jgi:hypothetical protein